MKTVSENLKESAKTIRDLLNDLEKHSSIYKWYKESRGIVYAGNKYKWKDLESEGLIIQSRVLKLYDKHFQLLKNLLNDQTKGTAKTLNETNSLIQAVIQQEDTKYHKQAQTIFKKAYEALDNQVELLSRLYDPSSGTATLVVDTNALLINPDLEDWELDEVSKFDIAFTPPVLSELDKLKVNHSSDNVRQKSGKIIRKLKEYRRRGKLTEGVTLVKNKSEIFAVAVEPNMEKSLSWLEADNNDDRILASAIEIMKRRPKSPLLVVTNDINLQNKAEFAQIPFIEPPSNE